MLTHKVKILNQVFVCSSTKPTGHQCVDVILVCFFSLSSQDYTCPRCDSGFIEELLDERRCVDPKHMRQWNNLLSIFSFANNCKHYYRLSGYNCCSIEQKCDACLFDSTIFMGKWRHLLCLFCLEIREHGSFSQKEAVPFILVCMWVFVKKKNMVEDRRNC